MLTLRRASERGHDRLDWLNSYHTFSFDEYHDTAHMGVSNLRVINDDTVAPGGGFVTHDHSNMEIVSYVLSGRLEHKDSMGNGSIIRPGDVQRLSAGAGVQHSEFNPSATESVHFLQIWLQPSKMGVKPDYEKKHFSKDQRRGKLCLLVSPDGREGSISTHQNALLYGSLLQAGETVEYNLNDDRHAWVQVARGSITVNSNVLKEGDGAHIEKESVICFEGQDHADTLLFDLP